MINDRSKMLAGEKYTEQSAAIKSRVQDQAYKNVSGDEAGSRRGNSRVQSARHGETGFRGALIRIAQPLGEQLDMLLTLDQTAYRQTGDFLDLIGI